LRDTLATVRDADMRTSLPAIFALGDCTGLGGARLALAEGTLAGLAAARDLGAPGTSETRALLARARRDAARHARFQAALRRLYAAPRLRLERAHPDTPVCRCEGVTRAAVEAAISEGYGHAGDVKRRTRVGMGRCQGRYCGPLIDAAVAEAGGRTRDAQSGFAPRAPVKPVAIEDLAPAKGS